MKIDLHCHTLNTKSGDVNRNVDLETFSNCMKNINIGIVALTNHNKFDINQYELFSEKNKNVLILPGVELDVEDNILGYKEHGHVIIIASNNETKKFSTILDKNITVSPDDFTIDILDLAQLTFNFNNLIVLFHYKKSPYLSSEAIEKFKEKCNKDAVVLLEPSNARRAGIIIRGENEKSWFGSDNLNWDNYPEKELPNCAFHITSFNQLFQLLNKNNEALTLQNFMNNKGPEKFIIDPFNDLKLEIGLYKDINIIFGGKATGKTNILSNLKKKLIQKYKNTRSFIIEEKEKDIKKLLSYEPTEEDIKLLENNNCYDEFSKLKNWSWSNISLINKYKKYYESSSGNPLYEKLKITNTHFSENINDTDLSSKYKIMDSDIKKIKEVLNIDMELMKNDKVTLVNLLNKLIELKKNDYLEEYFNLKSLFLEKYSIEKINKLLSFKQGTVSKPTSTGFTCFFDDMKNLYKTIEKLIINSDYSISLSDKCIGELETKGKIYRRTKLGFGTIQKSNNKENHNEHIHKGATHKDFNNLISNFKECKNNFNDLGKINKTIEDIKEKIYEVNSYSYFINYTNFLVSNFSEDFTPSNGEKTILLVDSILNDDNADVIILDEPDSGMGSDYVNQHLLPKIIERANENKIIIIATHDPNLVVRSFPYLCIYREESKPNVYKTYKGSYFEDNMINIEDSNDKVKWIDKCIEKCEGGLTAIVEREKTYGHY